MPIFQGVEGAEFPSYFGHKIFQHRSTIWHLPDYKIVKKKFFEKYFKNWTFSPNFETLGHLRKLKMTVSESLILRG